MPQSGARPGLVDLCKAGGPCEYIGSIQATTRRTLLSCTTPLISLPFDAAPPPLFARRTTMKAMAKIAAMNHGRFFRLNPRSGIRLPHLLHRARGGRRWRHRTVCHGSVRHSAACATACTATDRLDIHFGLALLPEEVVIVDVQREVRPQRVEYGIESRLPRLVGRECGLESELRGGNELVHMKVDLLDRLIAKRHGHTEVLLKVLAQRLGFESALSSYQTGKTTFD